MGFTTVFSTNENWTYVVGKKPQPGVTYRSVRKTKVAGYFHHSRPAPSSPSPVDAYRPKLEADAEDKKEKKTAMTCVVPEATVEHRLLFVSNIIDLPGEANGAAKYAEALTHEWQLRLPFVPEADVHCEFQTPLRSGPKQRLITRIRVPVSQVQAVCDSLTTTSATTTAGSSGASGVVAVDPHRFNAYMSDHETNLSYTDKREAEFQFVNPLRFCSPLFAVNALSAMFAKPLTSNAPLHPMDEIGHRHEVCINMMKIDKLKLARSFCSHLGDAYTTGVSISLQPFLRTESTPNDAHPSLATAEDAHVHCHGQPEAKNRARYFTVSVTSERDSNYRLMDCLQLAYVFCLFVASTNSEHLENNLSQLTKCAGFVSRLQLPYFIRYLMTSRVAVGPEAFLACKADLEKVAPAASCSLASPAAALALPRYVRPYQSLVLCPGDTAKQRVEFLLRSLVLDGSRDMVDLGCGTGYNMMRIVRKLESCLSKGAKRSESSSSTTETTTSTSTAQTSTLGSCCYVGIDPDAGELQKFQMAAQRLNATHCRVLAFPNLESYCMWREECCSDRVCRVDLIVTEMIEHMQPGESAALLRTALTQLPVHRAILTTPNATFNRNYDPATIFGKRPEQDEKKEAQRYRHPDHKWEPTRKEFEGFLSDVLTPPLATKGVEYQVQVVDVGDCVDGECVSHGAILQGKKPSLPSFPN